MGRPWSRQTDQVAGGASPNPPTMHNVSQGDFVAVAGMADGKIPRSWLKSAASSRTRSEEPARCGERVGLSIRHKVVLMRVLHGRVRDALPEDRTINHVPLRHVRAGSGSAGTCLDTWTVRSGLPGAL